ncbi:MAG: phosphonate ABC transporter, permease protein PhnE, partial [Cyanobacteria bacterium P01_D01_bin.71]
MNITPDSIPSESSDRLLRQYQRGWTQQLMRTFLLGVVICISFVVVELFDGERLVAGLPAIAQLLGEMWPPDFSRLPQWTKPIVDTLAMSIAGTAIAVGLSLPLCFLAARNTTPHPLPFHLTRTLFNIARAIPELILGMILVAAVGFGKLPGTLALGLHSVGMMGKFFAETIELSDPAP